jgi:hypothetical protein
MKNKLIPVNYTTGRKEMQVKIDGFEAEKIIPANDSVRLLPIASGECGQRA